MKSTGTISATTFVIAISLATAFVPFTPPISQKHVIPMYRMPFVTPTSATSSSSSSVLFAIDYNDPVVAEEFAKVQPMDLDDVEEELLQTGIKAPATMNEMDIKLMLVELRLRNSGALNNKKKEIPKTFSSKFEEALYTKPAFAEYYDELKAAGDMNTMNVVAEYLNDREDAKKRYGKDYASALRKADVALTAPPPVNSPTLTFSGFPSNMGEMGVKMTLEALGSVSDFECNESEDFPILTGKITYDDIEDAKAAVEKYNGMDMGMGTTLEIVSV